MVIGKWNVFNVSSGKNLKKDDDDEKFTFIFYKPKKQEEKILDRYSRISHSKRKCYDC